MSVRLLLFALVLTGAADAREAPRTLEEILRCNADAVGAEALAKLGGVSYRLEIKEPGFTVEGHYRATRDGRVRIDIYADGERVLAEGLHEGEAWIWQQGDNHARPGSAKGAEALRHGIEQPGHFHALDHLEASGREVELARSDTIEGVNYDVVSVTLADGYRQWYWIHPESCLAIRKRNFRAFHPDMDPSEIWVETRYSDFRTVGGVTRAFLSVNVDLATGETLGTVRVLEYVPNPELEPGSLAPP